MKSYLSFEVEMFLGAPLDLGPDAGVCDRRGCERRAAIIVPGGCVLCDECGAEFGVDTAGVYRIPIAELFNSDSEFLRARSDEYEERLRECRDRLLLPATAEREALVGGLARAHVDALIRSCNEDAVSPPAKRDDDEEVEPE